MESWEFQSHSLTNTVRINLKLSGQQKAKEEDSRSDYGIMTAELHNRLCLERENISDFLSREKCNGIMGVPITFLDKYNPDQFEIIGLDRYVEDNPRPGYRFRICGRETYARILIKRRLKIDN